MKRVARAALDAATGLSDKVSDSLGISFAEAARRVDEVVNNVEEKPFKADIDIDRRRRHLNELWSESKDNALAAAYLLERGIPSEIISEARDIRGHAGLKMWDHGEVAGTHPAMVSLIRNSKGVPISIHRTYFVAGSGKEKKIMPPLENITGGCVRLGEPEDTLVLAEGIETALAAWATTGHPAWATISAHGLEEFKSIPRHVKKVIICADNDASFTGQAAAFTCAKHMKQRLKVQTEVIMPLTLGTDMVDTLNGMRPETRYGSLCFAGDADVQVWSS